MKKKKGLTILLSVLAVCVVGYVVSRIIDWPVDYDNASGNVAKSTRFSRKTAGEGDSNMQELLMNDEEYRNNIVAAYMVMKTRSDQFNALVEASDQVAGNIPEFSAVLKDMKDAQPIINNVCASMEAAGEDLNAVLSGESAKNVAQNTNNAAVAYNLLQKQNNLATRFIDTADAYLKNNAGSDPLKFIRDQWLEYQQVTAFLNKDDKTAAELKKKGYQLAAEKTAAVLQEFPQEFQMSLFSNTGLELVMGYNSDFTQYFADQAGVITVNDEFKVGDNGFQVGDKFIVGDRFTVGDQNFVVGTDFKVGDGFQIGDKLIVMGDHVFYVGDGFKVGDGFQVNDGFVVNDGFQVNDEFQVNNEFQVNDDFKVGSDFLVGDKFTIGDLVGVMGFSMPFTALHDAATNVIVVNSVPGLQAEFTPLQDQFGVIMQDQFGLVNDLATQTQQF